MNKMNKPAILGGNAVRRQAFPERTTMGEAEKKAVRDVMDSNVLSDFIGAPGDCFMGGKKVRAFERAWADEYRFNHAISVNSWTSGLVTAIGAIGIEPGDEVICSPFTMSASATCALFYGGIPVFADIDPNTFCLDPVSIEQRITARTRAIVVVHLFGHPADMDAIMALGKRYKLRVIEDAAQAPGVFYKGRAVGAIGDIGGFSLNYHKHIHTGEGGMLVTQDDELALRCQLIRNHGENALEHYDFLEPVNIIGANYRLTELQAAIGIEQLKRLEEYLQIRQKLAAHFTERLERMPGITVQKTVPDCTHAYYVYPFRFDAEQAGLSRDLFVKAVNAELQPATGFETTPLIGGYVRPLYLNPIYQQRRAIGRGGWPFSLVQPDRLDYAQGLCPVVERMHDRELVLCPLVREPLTTADIDDLADAIEKVLMNAPSIRQHFSE